MVLTNSGRKLAYSRLHVEDGEGRSLNARIEVASARRMAVLVEDAAAVYPVRIDPTFSDENWISISPSIPGAYGLVRATVTDGLGNLYIGGDFNVVGHVFATNIAKWNGSRWSALGSGMGGTPRPGGTLPYVYALAVSGRDLYVGGGFTMVGGSAACNIAKWEGNNWSSLGSGMDDEVRALAVSGSGLYAGGRFTTAGGGTANYIAKWDGSSWSPLGSGMNGGVLALAVSGSDLYVGGLFTTAGGSNANYIAKWNGRSWSALGLGMDYAVATLAVSGSDVYAGGWFTTAGGSAAKYIAKWNGSNWSALGSGMEGTYPCCVLALAMSGSDLYAGGGGSQRRAAGRPPTLPDGAEAVGRPWAPG